MQHQMDEERTKWREDPAPESLFGVGEVESPALSHKNLTANLLGIQNLQIRNPTRSITTELPVLEGHLSRKSSAQHTRSAGNATPQRQDSIQSCVNVETLDTPL